MNESEGFLVVLKTAEKPNRANIQYRGADRLPCYRLADQDPIETEVEAMERYVFGDVRDEDSGLIRSYETAIDLLKAFRNSPREFELLWCRYVPNADQEETLKTSAFGKQLGFDVAGVSGDCWSIVADIRTASEIFHFHKKLNENGLFDYADDAWAYLNEYRQLKLHDHDLPLSVVEVHLVERA